VNQALLKKLAKRNRWLPRKLAFTREGKFYILITFGIGFAAINTGNNLLYLLLGMLLSVILLSGFLSEMAIRGARVKRLSQPDAFAGVPVRHTLELANVARRGPGFSLAAREVFVDPEEVGAVRLGRKRRAQVEARKPGQAPTPVMHLAAGVRRAVNLDVTFPRRGTHLSFGLRVETGFPFSLFVKSRVFEAAHETLVFPALIPDLPVEEVMAWLAGEAEASRRVGRGVDIYGVRDFREGDAPNRIHWKLTARRGRPVTREFEDLHGREVRLFLFNAARDAARGEAAVSVATTLAEVLGGGGARVLLATLDSARQAVRPLDERGVILAHLATLPLHPDPGAHLSSALGELERLPGNWIVVTPEPLPRQPASPRWLVVEPPEEAAHG
jgi:uncharacterized protein (DUF58 family)